MDGEGGQKRIWVLTGARAGDNAQALALAEMVQEACENDSIVEEKRLSYNALRFLPNILIPPSQAVLQQAARAQLTPPWPDLVIGVGRRSVPVARWIRQRNPAARIVWLGRPRAPLAWFDLLLTTPQYGLPEDLPNVVMLDLPPAAPPVNDEEELARWREKFAHLPRPWTGVLVGGARWPVLFDAEDARRLGRAVERFRAAVGGSWLVSTSPRTGIRQARALHEALARPGWFFFWRGGSGLHDRGGGAHGKTGVPVSHAARPARAGVACAAGAGPVAGGARRSFTAAEHAGLLRTVGGARPCGVAGQSGAGVWRNPFRLAGNGAGSGGAAHCEMAGGVK